MMHRAFVAAAALLAVAGTATAQVRGLPVYNPGVPSGIGIYGDIGFPNAAAGDGTTYAVSGRAGFGPLGVTATVGIFNPAGPADSRTVLGATGNVRVFGGGLVPVSVTLQGGYGYVKLVDGPTADDDVTEQRFPVGLGIAVNVPTPVVSIKPWIAPRVDVVRAKVGSVSDTDAKFGASGGVEINSLTGIGLQLSYDWVKADGGNRGVFGIGLHAGLRIPGL